MNRERSNIREMDGYVSGEQPTDDLTIKLNTNENPYPPSSKVAEVLSSFPANDLRRYPNPTASEFRELAAELHGLDPENIIATRGGDELLRLAITTFVDPGESMGVTNPTYSLYPVLAQIQNCQVVKVDLDENWLTPADFAAKMNQAGVKLTLLVNPNAPSGSILTTDQVSSMANQLDSILLLDEAYADFTDDTYQTTQLVSEHDNLIILRTLSKGYSLAGLRFGYGLGDKDLIFPMMNKTRDSYNLDAITQSIATAALRDQTHAKNNCAQVISERSRLRNALETLNIPSPLSHANFLLATVNHPSIDAAEVYARLKERHILVRYFSEPRLADKLRITVGTPEENVSLLTALQDILQL